MRSGDHAEAERAKTFAEFVELPGTHHLRPGAQTKRSRLAAASNRRAKSSKAIHRPIGQARNVSSMVARRGATVVITRSLKVSPLIASTRLNSSKRVVFSHFCQSPCSTCAGGRLRALTPPGQSCRRAGHVHRQTAGLQQHEPGKGFDRADFLVLRILFRFPCATVATRQFVAQQAQGGGARQRRLVAQPQIYRPTIGPFVVASESDQ